MSVSQTDRAGTTSSSTDHDCGAACAQMVLETIGAGILDQDDLYADNHSHSLLDGSGWATAPTGFSWTLNDRRPAPASPNYFALFALGTEDCSRALLDHPPLPGRARRAVTAGLMDH